MSNREKNIATLVDGFEGSLDFLRKRNPEITEQNYDIIKDIMTRYMAEWMDKPETECNSNIDELIEQVFQILLRLEVMHMIHTHRKTAHG